jgi:predicted transcriptional regulator
MIISEKQVHELMMVAHVYLRLLEDIAKNQPEALSECGNNNKRYVAALLKEITSQQCTKHMVIQ